MLLKILETGCKGKKARCDISNDYNGDDVLGLEIEKRVVYADCSRDS